MYWEADLTPEKQKLPFRFQGPSGSSDFQLKTFNEQSFN